MLRKKKNPEAGEGECERKDEISNGKSNKVGVSFSLFTVLKYYFLILGKVIQSYCLGFMVSFIVFFFNIFGRSQCGCGCTDLLLWASISCENFMDNDQSWEAFL
jgi:hypothetical protein